jgi:hypothetical protein
MKKSNISTEICNEIRIVIRSGATRKQIMEKYKISDHTFHQIRTGTFNGYRILSVGSSTPVAHQLLRHSSPSDQEVQNPAGQLQQE